MRRLVAVLLCIPLALATLVGCSPSAPACVPRLTVTPSHPHPGDAIRVESSDVCEVATPRDGWRIVVSPTGDRGADTAVITSAGFDGSFGVTVRLPDAMAAGEASAGIENWDTSTCADDASCATPSGGFTVDAD